MNENENNFESLRRLLELKRHEVPPPGYFNSFSGQIIVRIRAGEAKATRPAAEAEIPWFLKFLQLFELKPAFAGAFASALCLLLIFGIVYADRPEATPQSVLPAAGQSSGSFAAMTPMPMAQNGNSTGLVASNNPANSLQPVASVFGSQNSFLQPVSFSPSGN